MSKLTHHALQDVIFQSHASMPATIASPRPGFVHAHESSGEFTSWLTQHPGRADVPAPGLATAVAT